MSLITVIIPARKEPYIRETLKDLYDNAAGEIEVIVFLDGDRPEYRIPRRKGMRVLHNKTVKGVRWCMNHGVDIAKGKYVMKLDAHCAIGEGWDEILQADCEDNWIVVPRRYWWDAPNWKMRDKPLVDAMFYLYPFFRPYNPRLTCRAWTEISDLPCRANDEVDIEEDMGFQGSSWFMTKKHYDRLGGQDAHGYGTFAEEPEELGLKTQLGPWEGKIMRNKKTWYAHWSKPASHWRNPPEVAGRVTDEEREKGYRYCWDYWWNNRWEKRIHDFDWLVEKFWPIPTWPENWRWLVSQYDRYDLKELPISRWIE